MAQTMKLPAKDGHRLEVYIAQPAGRPRAGLVVCQEIFGVNGHIRAVAEGFAGQGYLTVAPALFDRIEPGLELDYDAEGIARGRAVRAQITAEQALNDIAAAMAVASAAGKVGVVGYCWGGTLAWLAACRLGPDAAVCYYGSQIHAHRHERPACPVMMHFGELDGSIPPEHVEAIRAARPEVTIHSYPAGHGFNCDARADFHEISARVAGERTQDFLARHLV